MKKMTLENRVLLEQLLNTVNMNLKEIGKAINKDGTSVAREINKYSRHYEVSNASKSGNTCIYVSTCTKTKVCKVCNITHHSAYCRTCVKCNKNCLDYDNVCPKLKKGTSCL